MSPRYEHDPLCALMKNESCSGVGGSDWGHYLDQPTCRNCGARCDCDRIGEIRNALGDELREFNTKTAGFYGNPEADKARRVALMAAEKTVRGER